MKVGIAGFSGSGKSTVFHWLTGAKPDPSKSQQGQVGVARIADVRLDWLSERFQPKKTTPAALEFLDTPGLLPTERRDNPRRLGIMRDAGGLLVVLNGFAGPPHPTLSPRGRGQGEGGAWADALRSFREELLFADLEVVLGRIGRLEDSLRKPRPAKQKETEQAELALLQRLVGAFELGQGAASLGLNDEDERAVRSFQLLTLKPELVLVNCSEDRIGQPLPADLLALAPTAIQAPAKFALEIEELPEDERQTFLTDFLGGKNATACGRDEVLRTIFAAMGQIVFFTIGDDECRAWSVPKGTIAVDGAGQIHTDFAKGFVRGEVVAFDDFKRVGSLKEAKTHGVYRLESKTYVIQDGDIMHVLASK